MENREKNINHKKIFAIFHSLMPLHIWQVSIECMSLLWAVCQDRPCILVGLALEPDGLSSLPSAHAVSLPHPVSSYLALPNLIFGWIYLHLFALSFPGLPSLNLHFFRSAQILAHITGPHSSAESEVGYSDPRTHLRETNGTELQLSPNLLFQD